MKLNLAPLLGPRELAQIFGVKSGTVFSWMSRHVDLPPSIKIEGTTRWRPETVKRWIEKKEKEKRKREFGD
jgi:predicted DNA-binding transcriptional regulator AlpA